MAGSFQGGGARALDLIRALPRVSLANLKPNPGSRKLVNRWWRCGKRWGTGALKAAFYGRAGGLLSRKVGLNVRLQSFIAERKIFPCGSDS